MSQVSYFPQALLLFNCTKKIPVDVKKSVLVDDLLNSQLGLQKKIILVVFIIYLEEVQALEQLGFQWTQTYYLQQWI